MGPPHFLLVTFPAQGHINPSLQFAKRLLRMGATATFATSVSARRRMSSGFLLPEGLTFTTFSDGYDDGFKMSGGDMNHYMSELKRRGSETLGQIIEDAAREGRPISCLVYTLLLPWAAGVARGRGIPSALLWIQPATVLDLYYYYFNGFGDEIKRASSCPDEDEDEAKMSFPGLSLSFATRDIPSFLVPSSAYTFVIPTFQEQLEALEQETNPKVLVNTFAELEPEGLSAVGKLNLISVGPLIPSAFLGSEDYPSDTAFGCDLFPDPSRSYIEWLDTQEEASVVYVSFGSISVLEKPQKEEVARALLESGRPFLWVIRSPGDHEEKKGAKKDHNEDEDELGCREELERQGMIVPWCSQVEVLSHPAVGCFVTHCGWNSTLESLATGVPVVAFPQWTDQPTSAKLIEDEWRTGVRVRATTNIEKERGGGGGGVLVEAKELRRCLEMVMGKGAAGEEMRRNAKKWKELAREAVKEGGSSHKNLRAFVDEIKGGSACESKMMGKLSL